MSYVRSLFTESRRHSHNGPATRAQSIAPPLYVIDFFFHLFPTHPIRLTMINSTINSMIDQENANLLHKDQPTPGITIDLLRPPETSNNDIHFISIASSGVSIFRFEILTYLKKFPVCNSQFNDSNSFFSLALVFSDLSINQIKINKSVYIKPELACVFDNLNLEGQKQILAGYTKRMGRKK